VNKRSLLSAFLTAIIISGLILVSTVHFCTVHASTNVSGIITSDTTWTKVNSPYILTGPVGVGKGVTLTIEAGVVVNGSGIEVEGTLRARGNSADKIYFNNMQIIFTTASTSWNEQTSSGSIIENTIFQGSTEISINNTSPKINSNHIHGNIIVGYEGAPIISNNIIDADYYIAIQTGSGSTIILNNTITSHVRNYNGIVASDSAVISNNTVLGNNDEKGVGIKSGSRSYVSNNVISGFQTGIYAGDSEIERNLIVKNYYGIDWGYGDSVIRNNTIANNSVGIFSQGITSSTIIYNNIQGNSIYNIELHSYETADVNATYNWWGTTDTQLINQTIHDSKNDFHLGTVTFIPFLTAQNPEAAPTSAPSPTLEIPEFPSWIILTLLIIVVIGVDLLVYFKKRKH
jgi:hypothetical protein